MGVRVSVDCSGCRVIISRMVQSVPTLTDGDDQPSPLHDTHPSVCFLIVYVSPSGGLF